MLWRITALTTIWRHSEGWEGEQTGPALNLKLDSWRCFPLKQMQWCQIKSLGLRYSTQWLCPLTAANIFPWGQNPESWPSSVHWKSTGLQESSRPSVPAWDCWDIQPWILSSYKGVQHLDITRLSWHCGVSQITKSPLQYMFTLPFLFLCNPLQEWWWVLKEGHLYLAFAMTNLCCTHANASYSANTDWEHPWCSG